MIRNLHQEVEDLKAENKDLIINEQLEEVQANLNDYVHNQQLQKKEETHSKVIVTKEDLHQMKVSELMEDRDKLKITVTDQQAQIADQSIRIVTSEQQVSELKQECDGLISALDNMMEQIR